VGWILNEKINFRRSEVGMKMLAHNAKEHPYVKNTVYTEAL